MKIGFFKAISVTGLALVGNPCGWAQGFVNLNFENAVININGFPPPYIVASNAIPGWTAYVGGNPQPAISYNSIPIDAARVTLQGTNTPVSSFRPIQGNFTVYILGSSRFGPQQSAAIGQTAQIPLTAASLIFWGYVDPSAVSFNGQTLPLYLLGSTANYNIYGIDLTPFAGQTSELLFTAPPQSLAMIDNIQFSPSIVPEPGSLALAALGTLLLSLRRRNGILTLFLGRALWTPSPHEERVGRGPGRGAV